MSALFVVVALIALYYLAQDALGRCRLPVMWGLFGVAPLALTSYWIRVNDFDPFLWIKIYSIMFCVCWGSWLRFTPRGASRWLLRTIALLLAANVLEAMVVDMLSGGLAHRLNAISGALLILTVPYGDQRASIDGHSRHRGLRLELPLSWIVGYTVWNWTFVYLNYPGYIGHHTAMLTAALIVALRDPRRWLQARAATLGISLLFTATSYSGMLAVMDASGCFDPRIATAAAALALGWMVIHVTRGIEEFPARRRDHGAFFTGPSLLRRRCCLPGAGCPRP